jgi:hypothetical protein
MNDTNAEFEFPDELIQALACGSCLPFVGAGIPRNVKNRSGIPLFPDWHGLIKEMALAARKEGKSKLASEIERAAEGTPDDFMKISQDAKDELGPGPWVNLLEQLFTVDRARVDPDSLAIPKAIWAISQEVVVTTNYDHVLEWSGQNVRSFDSASPSELEALPPRAAA